MYEWKTLSSPTLISAKQLNELSADGWELVDIAPFGGGWITYLRRAKAAS